jgi:hypothetical protein
LQPGDLDVAANTRNPYKPGQQSSRSAFRVHNPLWYNQPLCAMPLVAPSAGMGNGAGSAAATNLEQHNHRLSVSSLGVIDLV